MTLKRPHTSLSFKSLPGTEEGSLAPLVPRRTAAKTTPGMYQVFSQRASASGSHQEGHQGECVLQGSDNKSHLSHNEKNHKENRSDHVTDPPESRHFQMLLTASLALLGYSWLRLLDCGHVHSYGPCFQFSGVNIRDRFCSKSSNIFSKSWSASITSTGAAAGKRLPVTSHSS